VQNFLDLTKEIEDIGFLLKMGLVSKSFQIAVWKNPTVLRLFYTAYSQRTNLHTTVRARVACNAIPPSPAIRHKPEPPPPNDHL
jgi:hypothetical protein